MLKRSFFSDLYKYCSLPTFKITFFLILGVSIFFSIQNIQVINALVEGNGQAVNLDPSMLSSNPVYTVRDALLSSPYQASVIFLPILVSLVYSTHYQFGDDNFTQLLIPNWKVRLTGFIASSIVLSLLATLIFSIVNAIILLVFSRFNFKELFRIYFVFRCYGKSYDICNRSYFISFTFRNSNEKINDFINCRCFIIGNHFIRCSKRTFF